MGADRTHDRAGDPSRKSLDVGVQDIDSFAGPPFEHQDRHIPGLGGNRIFPTRQRQRRGSDEDAALQVGRERMRRSGRALEADPLHGDESFVGRGRFQLAECAHLPGRREDPGLATCQLMQLLGVGKRVESIEEAIDEIDLRLGERGVHPQAPSPDVMPCGGLDHVASRCAGEVRVVENHAAHPR